MAVMLKMSSINDLKWGAGNRADSAAGGVAGRDLPGHDRIIVQCLTDFSMYKLSLK